ncbi:MAG TPA: hypothetical protein PKL31_14760 [Fulvivirga sp.]|nr:hypothetical protein [Fulvivirga sp.]
MSKLLISFYSLFCVGFILKFFHIHYNAVLMLTGLGGVLVVSLILLFKKDKRYLQNIGICSWLLVLLSSLKFFPFGNVALILATIISVFIIVVLIKQHKYLGLIPLGLTAVIALLFHSLPTDSRYYLLNVKWNYEIERDFITLDKYSWLLYNNGNSNEALKISNQALEIAQKSGQKEWVAIIEEHANAIRMNNWEKYR